MQSAVSLQNEDKPFISTHPDSLLYLQKPSVIEAVLSREQVRMFSKQGQTATFVKGNTIEFELAGDQFWDMQTACLNFSLAINASSFIMSALDVIDSINIYYNDNPVEKIDDASVWAHAYLYNEASQGWFNTEARVLLGESTATSQAGSNTGCFGSRASPATYMIPLPLVSGFCRAKYLIPGINNRIRIVVQTAKNNMDVVAYSDDETKTSYTVSNASLQIDQVIVRNDYRQKVVEAMQSDTGFFIPYSTYQTNVLSLNAAAEQNVQLPFNLTNALSLCMVVEEPKTETKQVWMANKESFGCPAFTGLRVMTQSRLYTPPDDILSLAQLHRSTQQTQTTLMDLSSPGIITYSMLSGTYTQAATLAEAKYPFVLMGINLEKSVSRDDSVINDGISSVNGNNIFYIRLRTGSTNLAANSVLRTCIVCRKAISYSRNGIAVDQ